MVQRLSFGKVRGIPEVPREVRKKSPIFYGWIVLIVGFFCQLMVYGIRNSFSVFYVAILDEFGWSRADTALYFPLISNS